MRRTFMLGLLLALGFAAPGRATPPASTTAADTRELSAVRTVIDAVNRKDPDLYASVFTDDTVVQLHDGPVRVTGRVALRANRSAHFQRFPATRSEIVHLVQIGEKVVMHDRLGRSYSRLRADQSGQPRPFGRGMIDNVMGLNLRTRR
jgi:hypothetical protein